MRIDESRALLHRASLRARAATLAACLICAVLFSAPAAAQVQQCVWHYAGTTILHGVGLPAEGLCTALRAAWQAGGGTSGYTWHSCGRIGAEDPWSGQYVIRRTSNGTLTTTSFHAQAACWEDANALSTAEVQQLSWGVVLAWALTWAVMHLGRALLEGSGDGRAADE